jgi:hypothetical protein
MDEGFSGERNKGAARSYGYYRVVLCLRLLRTHPGKTVFIRNVQPTIFQ